MDSRPIKPEMNTEGFDEVYPFQQTIAIAGTAHSDGFCGPFSTLILKKFLSTKTLDEFKKPNYADLYKQVVAIEVNVRAITSF
jgi:hypothetical protein